mgnify:CR=1 FL=1
MSENEKIIAPIGVYAGILCMDPVEDNFGKLLLRRRNVPDSIIPGESFRGNWELPGGAVEQNEKDIYSYDYLSRILKRLVKERVGMEIDLPPNATFYPVFLGGKIVDLAMVTVIQIYRLPLFEPTAELCWVDCKQLNNMADQFCPADEKRSISGEGLLSGSGKRMHCMALHAMLSSPDRDSAALAWDTLESIQEKWPSIE